MKISNRILGQLAGTQRFSAHAAVCLVAIGLVLAEAPRWPAILPQPTNRRSMSNS